MRFRMKTRGIEMTSHLKKLASRRVRFAFSRFSPRISRVEVSLTDVNGPKGGVDQRCQVRVVGNNTWHVKVTDTDADTEVALNRAISRARRAVARQLSRQWGKRVLAE